MIYLMSDLVLPAPPAPFQARIALPALLRRQADLDLHFAESFVYVAPPPSRHPESMKYRGVFSCTSACRTQPLSLNYYAPFPGARWPGLRLWLKKYAALNREP